MLLWMWLGLIQYNQIHLDDVGNLVVSSCCMKCRQEQYV